MKAEWTNKDSLSIESTGQKAILVIDMPTSCLDCEVMLGVDCEGKKREVLETIKNGGRHISCPLKPISTMIPIEWIENFMKKYDYYEYDMLIDAWKKQND